MTATSLGAPPGFHFLGCGQIESLRPRVTMTLCHLWQVERTDGVTLRFASHDRTVHFRGADFVPLGPNASDLQQAEAMAESDMTIVGFLSSDAIRPADIHAGRYQLASIRHWIVDWQRPWQWAWLREHRWWLKSVKQVGSIFQAQVVGIERFLTIPAGRRHEIECDLTLGEPACGANPVTNLAAVVEAVANNTTPILAVSDSRRAFTITAASWTPPRDGLMKLGDATAVDGPNKGHRVHISDHVGRNLVVEKAFPFAIRPGDTFAIMSGCDKTKTTCHDDYNRWNFNGGFAFLPSASDVQMKPVET